MGDRDYDVRQRAEAALARLGFDAFDVLNDATASDDLEIAARARRLLQHNKFEWAAKDDPPEVRE